MALTVVSENDKIVKDKTLKLNIHNPTNVNALKIPTYIPIKVEKQFKIIFFKGTTNQAIFHFKDVHPKMHCAVMNFANSHVAAGGDMSCNTQEEELCKTIIDLYPSLLKHTDERKHYIKFRWFDKVKYLSDLSLYRLDNIQSVGKYDMIKDPISVSVITAAAPNLSTNKIQIKRFIEDKQQLMNDIKNIIRTTILAPFLVKNAKNVNILILGAFGCGAFSPKSTIEDSYNELIANLHIEVLMETNIHMLYDYICFSIPDDKNYDVFNTTFKTSPLELYYC